MSWIDIPVDGWRDFIKKASDLVEAVAFNQSFLCRGQGDTRWTLKPSLLRCFRAGASQKKVLTLEDAALKSYRPEALAYVPKHVLPTEEHDILSWWTIMQHYGAPTRLLDWTASPYVAAYFAVIDQPKRDGAIWFVMNRELNQAMGNFADGDRLKQVGPLDQHFMKTGNQSRLHTIKQTTPTDRMIAQHSLFTVAERVTDDHARVIDEALVGSGRSGFRYGRLIIRRKDKDLFLLHLHAMNIKASTLFPGIDGVGRSVSELVQLSRRR